MKDSDTRQAVTVMKATLDRLPQYFYYLLDQHRDGNSFVSSTAIAEALGLNPVQVRKDLASVSSVAGRPNRGFDTDQLIADIRSFLGFDHEDEAIVVGVGHLGAALMHYNGFRQANINIIVGFDVNPDVVGTDIDGHPVIALSKMASLLPRLGVRLGILTVPRDEAQAVAEQMVAAGIRAIWNWSPTVLNLPPHVIVRNENAASHLMILSQQLRGVLERENGV